MAEHGRIQNDEIKKKIKKAECEYDGTKKKPDQ